MAMTAFGVIYFPPDQYDDLHSDNPSTWIQSVLIHEKVHAHRQAKMGGTQWGLRYIVSRKFRLNEELLAIREQMLFLKKHNGSYDIERKARQFAGAAYLWVLPYQQAITVLNNLWNSCNTQEVR